MCSSDLAVPKVFLKVALNGIVKEARSRGVRRVTPELMDEINRKRRGS